MAQILYQKVANDIKKNILSGFYEVGNLMPTENELESKYDVSKITIRKAVDQLVAEGYIAKKSGIGTRVISNNLFNKLSKARSYSSIVNEQGNLSKIILKIENKNISVTPLKNKIQAHDILYIKKLYLLNNEPFIIVEHYLPDMTLPTRKEDLQEQSLYKLLKDGGKDIEEFKDEFSATIMSNENQNLLKKNESLGLKRIRQGYSNTGKLIEYTVSIYDSEKMPYKIEYEI